MTLMMMAIYCWLLQPFRHYHHYHHYPHDSDFFLVVVVVVVVVCADRKRQAPFREAFD
jgi:hypothetical protein